MMRKFLVALLLIACAGPLAAGEDIWIYLVRHAEKQKADKDPELTEDGFRRADDLANLLGDAGLTNVFSSDYARTTQTAGPIASQLGVEIELYDPRALETFAEKLKKTPGRHLVVGHSNTTPALVGFLGGDPGSPIDEAVEYDRLYLVVISPDGSTESSLLRFGARARP